MSGPKVFRVVTRDELFANCQGHLARVDAAIVEWMKAAQQRGAASRLTSTPSGVGRQPCTTSLRRIGFTDLQKQASLEISFLQSDIQARRDRAAAAAVEARQARRRVSRTAEMLLQELDRAGRTVPDDLRAALKSGEPDEANTAVNRAFRLLSNIPQRQGQRQATRTCHATRAWRGSHDARRWLAKHPMTSTRAAIYASINTWRRSPP